MYKFSETKWFDNEKEYIDGLSRKSNQKVVAVCPVCQNKRTISFGNITSAGTTRCRPCTFHEKYYGEMVGKKYGRLTVVSVDTKPYIAKTDGKFRVKLNCACDCGKEVTPLAFSVKQGTTISCGCFKLEQTKEQGLKNVGINNGQYNPNKTDEERAYDVFKRRNPEAMKWKKQVKLVGKCCLCGSSEKLEAHHIFSSKTHPELQYDVSNGACVCQKHHVGLHSFMGNYLIPCTPDSILAYSIELESVGINANSGNQIP